jgi:hypothetical protein
MLQRSKLYAAGLLLAVFVAGVAVGTGVSLAASDSGRRDGGDRTRAERESYATRLEHELGLSPVQKDSVDHILDAYQDSMSTLWSAMRPHVDSIRTHVRGDIMLLLDPSQQDLYRTYTHRVDSARAAREEGGRHGRR